MNNNDKRFETKLQSFFHDSPDKPFILLTGENHVKRAQNICEKLGIAYDDRFGSDIIASSMERYFLPKGAPRAVELQLNFLQNPEFIHPLSGKKYTNFPTLDKNVFKQAVDETIDEISKINFNNNFDKFVYIWRYLQEILKKHTSDEYKKYWDLAPADTRFPNHTIFDHVKVTSALNAEKIDNLILNKMSLFILSIGPVQEFISQARKTQDLYWGSYILSYLTWIGIEEVVKEFGPDSIIFPDLSGQPLFDKWLLDRKLNLSEQPQTLNLKTPTIPNRFFAILPEIDPEKIKSLELEKKIKEKFIEIGEYVLGQLLGKSPEIEEFKEQLDHFPYVYWVMLPLENSKGNKSDWEIQIEKIKMYFDAKEIANSIKFLEFLKENAEYKPNIGNIYGLLYLFMEKMMGSRKSIRNFEQYTDTGRKCSVCGQYNPVVYRCTKQEDELLQSGRKSYKIRTLESQKTKIKKSNDTSISYKYLAQGEGLCSICLTKRGADIYFGKQLGKNNVETDFPSTASIALMNLDKNPDEQLQMLFQKFKNILGIHFDHQLLFQENLNEKYFIKYNLDTESLEQLNGLAKEMDKRVEELNLNKNKYYAVIKFDGDNMGKWLSGELAPYMTEMYHSNVQKNLPVEFKNRIINEKRLLTPSIHATISRALKDYSLNYVNDIIEKSGAGKVIYSGGDDVLAFINLESLLDIMVRIRASFSGLIDENKNPSFDKSNPGFVEYEDRIDMLLGEKVTGSMGVVIAHYKEELSEILSLVNLAEKQAKDTDDKDAFSIILLPHSGKRRTVTAKWDYENSDFNDPEGTIGLLKKINLFFKEKKISSSFIKKLEEYFYNLDLHEVSENIFENELKRAIKRSIDNSLTSKEKEKIGKEFEKLLITLYDCVGYENFINFLFILIFLNKGDDI